MKTLLTTTALVVALAAPALAQTSPGAEAELERSSPFVEAIGDTEIRASNLIGSRLYTAGDDVSETYVKGEEKDWNDIGEIGDVILSRDGKVNAVLVDLGGFLGIGEKTVAISMNELTLVSESEDQSDYFVVLQADRSMLENAPTYQDRMTDTPMDKSNALSTDTAISNTGFAAPTVEREGYKVASTDILNTDKLEGAKVYDLNDEWIGDVSKLLVDDNGKISEAIIDVGGFLGLGAKPVAIQFEGLTIMSKDSGSEIRVFLDATKDQLKDLPPYEE